MSYLEHGPSQECSEHVTAALKNRFIELFGQESDTEDLDVLQISIENDELFKSPKNDKKLNESSSIGSFKILSTPTHNSTQNNRLPETPGKNIAELKHFQSPRTPRPSVASLLSSPLTPKINAIRNNILLSKILSPIQKTPVHVNASIKRRLGSAPSQNKQTSADNYTNKTTQINKNKTYTNTKINPFKVANSSITIKKQKQPIKITKKVCETPTFTNTRTSTIINAPNTTQTKSIVERHNFAQEIKITVKNNNNNTISSNSTATSVEKSVVDKLEPTPAERTKIITLNNKHTPNNVYLAIAVDKNKYLSKNALKKITRNLASQM